MNVTILIPTLNRSDYILRILEFYKKNFFTGQILILDSSNREEKELNKTYIKRYIKNLHIDYIWSNGWSFELFKKYQKYIKKKNCIFSGDDDYILMDGLKKGLDFLKKNKNTVAVTGKGLIIRTYGKNFENILTSSEYKLTSVIENDVVERIKKFFNNYTVSIYSLCRTSIFKKTLKYSLLKKERYKCGFSGINGEILPCSIIVSFGKIYQIEAPLVVRTVGHIRYFQPNYVEIKDNKDFIKSKSYLIKCLNHSLAKNFNLKNCKEEIKLYVEGFFSLQSQKKQIYFPEIQNIYLKKIKNYLFFFMIFVFGNLKKSTNLYSIYYGFSWFSEDLNKIKKIFKEIPIKKVV